MNRANVENILIRRCGAALEAAGLDGSTINGVNADLNDPMWYALNRLGYAVADITAVADADITALAVEDEIVFLDIAELRALETAMNAASRLVDITIGPRRESLSQLSAQLTKTIEAKRAQIIRDFGDLSGAGLQAGTFSVSSQEDGENTY